MAEWWQGLADPAGLVGLFQLAWMDYAMVAARTALLACNRQEVAAAVAAAVAAVVVGVGAAVDSLEQELDYTPAVAVHSLLLAPDYRLAPEVAAH